MERFTSHYTKNELMNIAVDYMHEIKAENERCYEEGITDSRHINRLNDMYFAIQTLVIKMQIYNK